jgi:hypothetical protein
MQSAWLALSDEAATRTAGAIARDAGATLAGVRPHNYAGRPGRIALFDRDGLRYALVPGGPARLGFDTARFVPSAGQLTDYAEAVEEEYASGGLSEFVAGTTSPFREVTMPARLVAVRSVEGDALFAEESNDSDEEWDHAWLAAALTRRGLRLPTPDEWEYACGAGTGKLFRWGDDYPRAELVGGLALLVEPNLFGLVIGDDPERAEFTTDPAVLCGGDGGTALCGGYGAFVSWLSLATPYRDPDLAKAIIEGGIAAETPLRPVIEVG